MKKCILFFIFLNVVSAAYVKYICTVDHFVELESDNIVFFESPDFPRIMTDDERNQCAINFSKALIPEEQVKRFVIATSNFFCHDDHNDCDNLFDINTNITSYLFNLNDEYSGYTAFQGFAYFDDWGDDCPLESVSRVNPYQFSDLSQIIVLRSTYDPFIKRNQSCIWQFKAPEDYGFKIVITSLLINNDTIFKIENNEDVLITLTNIRKLRPRYIVDNYIKISLSNSNSSISIGYYEFAAYLTIVKNNVNHSLIDCGMAKKDNLVYWSYWNEYGYPNNAQCKYTLTISPNTEVIAKLLKKDVENSVDVINYYSYNNSLPNDSGQLNYQITFADDGNKERKVLWEFRSDGTVHSRGFEVEFETMNCSCGNSLITVPCEGKIDIFLMASNNVSNNRNFYCGKLECNFTIIMDSSCSSQFVVLSSMFDGYDEEYDIFKIISNNIGVNETVFNAAANDVLRLSSANENVLQVFTTISPNARYLTLIFSALKISTSLPTVIINETKPYYFHDFSYYNDKVPYSILLELSPNLKQRNATINVYSFIDLDEVNDVGIFNNASLTFQINLKKCFAVVANGVIKCRTNIESFVLVHFGSVEKFYFFQVADGDETIGAEGCVFKNNVFTVTDKTVFSALSNNRKKCKILFYSSSFNILQQIWSSHSVGSFDILVGNKEKLLANIDASSVLLWKDFPFFYNIYMIEIPLNTLAMLTFYDNPLVGSQYITTITKNPYKAIVTSPNYGTNDIVFYSDDSDFGTSCTEPFRIFVIQNNTLRFTILDMDVLLPNYFFFYYNETDINITSTFQSIIFGSSTLTVGCSCSSNVNCNIRMLAETVDSIEPETSMTSTIISTTVPFTMMQKSFSFIVTANYLLLFLQSLM